MSAQVGNPKLRAMGEGQARSACKLSMRGDERTIEKYNNYVRDHQQATETYTGSWRGFKRGERNEQN